MPREHIWNPERHCCDRCEAWEIVSGHCRGYEPHCPSCSGWLKWGTASLYAYPATLGAHDDGCPLKNQYVWISPDGNRWTGDADANA